MNEFSADWLALREPYDMRARNPSVLNSVVQTFNDVLAITIVDLGCGTGSMMRALSSCFPQHQDWRLFDNDLSLLERARATPHPAAGTVTVVLADLSRDLEVVSETPADMVTTSALLDLVSEAWLERLASKIAARSLPFYATITHDGRIDLTPADSFDAAVLAAVKAHQRSDKGFGPALGATAASFAITRLQSLGYSVVQGTSDWVIAPHDYDMQLEMLAGWAAAAHEMGERFTAVADWLARRCELLASGQSSMRIGHVDFWARQTGTR